MGRVEPFFRELDEILAPGLGTRIPLHKRHKIYLDLMDEATPFLPQVPCWHPLTRLNGDLAHLELSVLDVVDVIVSKTKRFTASDLDDIAAMIDRDLVAHERLLERFRAAVDMFLGDAREDDLPRFVRNLNQIERDLLGVEETEIDLPDRLRTDR